MRPGTGPAQRCTPTYLGGSNYLDRFIRNRLTQATVITASGATTLISNSYDDYSLTSCGQMASRTGLKLWDPTYLPSMPYRGKPHPDGAPGSYELLGLRSLGRVKTVYVDGKQLDTTLSGTTSYSQC